MLSVSFFEFDLITRQDNSQAIQAI